MNMNVTQPPAPLDVNDPRAALNDPKRGNEDYPAYDYLWHLAAISVIELDPPAPTGGPRKVTDTVWGDPRLSDKAALVALIDTGIADHVNLTGRIRHDLSIDFGTAAGGAVYRQNTDWAKFLNAWGSKSSAPASGSSPNREYRGRLKDLDTPTAIRGVLVGLGIGQPAPDPADRLKRLVKSLAQLTSDGVVLRDLAAQDQRYPSHGTASAGLVVGTPLIAGTAPADPANAKFQRGTPPYFGVDPWSEIISIAMSFEPEPMQLALAVLYAYTCGADVILMPRAIDDPARAPRPDPRDPWDLRHRTRYDLSKDWDLVEAVVVAVSKQIPIVCASGNEGDHQLIFPASLAGQDNNGLIAVGAVTARGRRSAYGNYGDGLTVVAPSNDGRLYNRHQVRIDPRAREATAHNYAIHDEIDYVPYAHEAPLTIDIPGPRGYQGDQLTGGDQSDDITLFGGTSAASAIVAGVLALMRRARASKSWSGISAKEWLKKSARQTLAGGPLTEDISNETDIDPNVHLAPRPGLTKAIFGAGLVDAKAAINLCRIAP